MCAQCIDVFPKRGGRGEGGKLIQQCGNLGRLGIIRRASDEAEHVIGKPADQNRHALVGLARGCAELVAQMREVGQGVVQECVD